jgi:hypothetical protein
VCAQILEHDNFLSHIAVTGEEKFHISGHVSQHNSFVWGSGPPREHLEEEEDCRWYVGRATDGAHCELFST